MQQKQARHTELSFTPQQLCSSISNHLKFTEDLLKDCSVPVGTMREIRARHQQIRTLTKLWSIAEIAEPHP